MIDRQALRRTIEAVPPGCRAAFVTRKWLEQVERELAAGDAAKAEVKALRSSSPRGADA